MVFKKVCDKSKKAEWFPFDKLEWNPKTEDNDAHFLLIEEDSKRDPVSIKFPENIKNDESFTVYVMENGKTIDTFSCN